MNTAMVTPALDMFASKPASVSANKPADNEQAPRFSDVLSKQHASQKTTQEQPKTTQAATKEQETTDSNVNNGLAENDTNTHHTNVLAPEEETTIALQPIGLLLTDNLVPATPARVDGANTPQTALLAQTADVRLVPAAAKTSVPVVQNFSASTVIQAGNAPAAPATDTSLFKQIGTVMATLAQPQAEARSTHQSVNPDPKNKADSTKATLAGATPFASKASPDAIKFKVTEFSTAMVDSATLAQSRFAAHNRPDTLTTALPDSAVPQTLSAASGASLLPTGQAVSLHGIAATPLSNPQWANDFGRQVLNFTQNSSNGTQIAELRLDPPELGPIRITLNLSENVANAAFFSPHALVRQTVENALPQLQQLLAQAGISLGEASVSDQGQAGNPAANESSASGNSNRNNSSSPSGLTAGSQLSDPVTATRSRDPDALVDTFV